MDDPDVKIISSMLKLGRKYEIPHFRRDVVRSLVRYFPLTLRDWDHLFESHSPNARYDSKVFTTDSDLVSYLDLAVEHSLDCLIPAICLRLYMLKRTTELCELLKSIDILKLAIKGRMRLLTDIHLTLNHWIYPDEEVEVHCEENRREIHRFTSEPDKRMSFLALPLQSLVDDLCTYALCTDCLLQLKSLYESGRVKFWAAVPTYFSFESWEVLQLHLKEGVFDRLHKGEHDFDFCQTLPSLRRRTCEGFGTSVKLAHKA